MTQKIIYMVLPFLLLIFVSAVNAQTATDAATKLRQQIHLLQEQKKAEVSKVREEAKAAIQAKREEFKTHLQAIKNQKKKALVERIDAKLGAVNKKHTAKFSEVLVRLQGFLDKIKQATTDSKVLIDVSTAQTAIDTAKGSVETQADKTYIMEITDDTTLRLNAGTAVSQLRQDLVSVHKLVVNAKQAVQKLNTDRKIIKKDATGSANL